MKLAVPQSNTAEAVYRWALDSSQRLNAFFKEFNNVNDLRFPTGCMIKFGGVMTPEGWVPCDGRELAVKSFPELAKIMGVDLSMARFAVPTDTGFMIKV